MERVQDVYFSLHTVYIFPSNSSIQSDFDDVGPE